MFREAWLTPEEWEATRLSLWVASWCVVVTLGPGIGLGWALARKRFPGKVLLESVVQLPMVMPPVLVGYLLMVLLGREGWLGSWLFAWFGLSIPFTTAAAVIASATVSFPLVVRSVRLAIESVDVRLEEASRVCGASPWDVFLTITLRGAWSGILLGMLLAFVRSIGEFGATIMFAGNIAGQSRTLPLALFRAMETPGGAAEVNRLAVLAIAISVLAVCASEYLHRRCQTAYEVG